MEERKKEYQRGQEEEEERRGLRKVGMKVGKVA